MFDFSLDKKMFAKSDDDLSCSRVTVQLTLGVCAVSWKGQGFVRQLRNQENGVCAVYVKRLMNLARIVAPCSLILYRVLWRSIRRLRHERSSGSLS